MKFHENWLNASASETKLKNLKIMPIHRECVELGDRALGSNKHELQIALFNM
jgi:hypothetical protein